MKILFDNQIFKAQKYGGISRYFSELFSYFNTTKDIKYEVPIRDTENEYLINLPSFSKENLSKKSFLKPNSKIKRKIIKIIELFDKNSNINLVKKALQKQDFDIFHPTYYSPYFLKYLKDKPFVLTVHDMIHEIYPQYFKFDFGKTAKYKKKLIERATKIVAISENTKKDIVKYYNVPEEKIRVIYHGNTLKPNANKQIKIPNLPKNYILFVGARGLYKNFTFFIESIAELLNIDKDMNIVVAGGYSNKNDFSKKEINLFEKLKIKEQIFQYSIDDDSLAYLYQNAICFVFPTLYEGFGIPVLEAFACGCPIVLSNTSSLPEVGGNAAIYFDPYNKNDMFEKVNKVVYDEILRKEMTAKGQIQLKKFSWEKTAIETIQIYKETKK
jgi:glycosyltransferase involved in cell wall biosynthesis